MNMRGLKQICSNALDQCVSGVAAKLRCGITPYRCLFLAYAVWMGFGVFPLVCYEGDSLHIIMGCAMMHNGGVEFPPEYSYAYDMQPLVTYVVLLFRSLFRFLDCEQSYCLLSAAASLLFAAGSIRLASRLTGIAKPALLLCLFLVPEAYACGMYPNSSVLAGCLFVWGCCFLVEKRSLVWPAILLSVAPLFRIDVLVVYPVVLPLLLWRGDSLRRSVALSASLALVTLSVVAVGCFLLSANPLGQTLGDYRGMVEDRHFARFVAQAVYSFYTVVNIILLPLGLAVLLRRRDLRLLSVALLPIILLHFLFRYSGCATKHYLYLIPFVIVLSSVGVRALWRRAGRSVALRVALPALLLVYLLVSVRFPFRNTPAANVAGSVALLGPRIPLFTAPHTPLHLTVGIGAGQLISTFDEMMLLTGNAFYPFFISDYKRMLDSSRRCVYGRLHGLSGITLVCFGWESSAFYPLPWIERGFDYEILDKDKFTVRVQAGGDSLTFVRRDMDDGVDAAVSSLRDAASRGEAYAVAEFTSPYFLDAFADSGLVVKEAERLYRVSR